MAEFSIKIGPIKNTIPEEEKYLSELSSLLGKISSVRSSLRWKIAAEHNIKDVIRKLEQKMENHIDGMKAVKETLYSSVSLYEKTENGLMNSFAVLSQSGANYQVLSREEFAALVKNYTRKEEAIISEELYDWIWSFQDKNTRDLLLKNPNYAVKIRREYLRASGKAKELYDKYSDEIVIASLSETGSSYHSGGKLYINYNTNMSDSRGAASIYFHEIGHFIVYKNSWVSENFVNDEMSAFDSAVKNDVTNYINNIESNYRNQFCSSITDPKKLEAAVTKATLAELKKELGVKPGNQSLKVSLDGVSDMIDAASNGKYRISYSHTGNTPSYWTDNTSRQANEAFAEMYSADFCNDSSELRFMKKNFPNAYAEYEKLKEKAIEK